MVEPQSRFAVNLLTSAAVTIRRSAVPVPKEIDLKLEVAPANLPRLAKIPRLRALKTPAKSATEISVLFRYQKPQVAQERTDAAGPPRRRSLPSDDQVRRTFGLVRARRMGKRNPWRIARPAPRSRHGA